MNLRLDPDGQPYAALNAQRNRCKSIDELYGLCEGILADRILVDEEVEFLADWLSHCVTLLHEWPANVIAPKVAEILCDGKISKGEASELKELLAKCIGGVPGDIAQIRATKLPCDDAPAPIVFADHSFCFTGKFEYGDRKLCQSITANLGGLIHKDITLGLDYLVIGTLASRDWKHSNHGRKIEEAVRNRETGAKTLIVSEEHWANCLNRT